MTPRPPPRTAGAAAAICIALAGCSGVVDADQAQVCERVAAALHPDGTVISRTSFAPVRGDTSGVRLRYVAQEPEADLPRPGDVTCLFVAPSGEGRLDLAAVETAQGRMDDSHLLILKRWWLEAGAGDRASETLVPAFTLGPVPAYWLQQAVNALAPATLFAALAVAFTLIHGLTGRIVLAIGEIAVAGGTSLLVLSSVVAQTATLTLAHLALGVVAAMVSAAVWTWMIGHLVLWRFRDRKGGGQGVLIAGIGIALVLREALTLHQNAAPGWLPPLLHMPVPLAGTPSFVATTTPTHLAAVLLTGGAVAGCVLALHRSSFGRAWRAMADDPGMAALCAVSPKALLGATCLISGGLAGLAGAMMAITFGSVDAALGLPLTLKALAAAILGGVGSVAGAAMGGLLVAALEMLWSSAFDIAYRDVVMYALLIGALAAWPHGLFGTTPRDV